MRIQHSPTTKKLLKVGDKNGIPVGMKTTLMRYKPSNLGFIPLKSLKFFAFIQLKKVFCNYQILILTHHKIAEHVMYFSP